jgi:hypothetical protein
MRLARGTLARLADAARGLARGAPSRVDLVEVRLDERRRATLVHHRDLRAPLGAAERRIDPSASGDPRGASG